MRLVTVAEMQQAERDCGVPVAQLMENAGLAVAQEAWLMLGELADRRILVLAGPGSNGGDGLVATRHLKDWGADVSVVLLKPRAEDDANLAALAEREVPVIPQGDGAKLDEALVGAELLIDALLGTGNTRPIDGALANVLDRLRETRSRRLSPRLLAVDLPTGLNADTGAVDPHCVAADQTVALGWSKIGLHTLPGSKYAGRVEVVDIGIPQTPPGDQAVGLAGPMTAPTSPRGQPLGLTEQMTGTKPGGQALSLTELMTPAWARATLPDRPPDAHKGTFGSAMVVAGSPQYTGAAYLACTGALRTGPGIVTLACGRSIYPTLAGKLSETTFEPLDDKDGFLSAEEASAVRRALTARDYDALLIGPGLGQHGYVTAFLRALLPALAPSTRNPLVGAGLKPAQNAPAAQSLRAVVLDADALNNLSKVEHWWQMLKLPTVITPHPGELSRLSGVSTEDIQSDRLAVARRCAAEWGVTIVLKGANTVVAAPDGRARLSPFANPGMATGGTGDVLAGAITGLIAQGVDPFDAASLGVYLHALAGDLVRRDLGDAGMLAGDVASALPRAIKELKGETAHGI